MNIGENIKLQVQHNMFVEIFPERYFKDFLIEKKLIRKVDIKEITIKDLRVDSKERDPIYQIIIKMRNGEEYIEFYENLTHIGEDNPKEIRDVRYATIASQLTE